MTTTPAQQDAILDRLSGPLVPVMPAFRDDESLDLDATARWIDHLVRAGIRLFWTTYGTSHYMSLGDQEIDELTAEIARVTSGRATFIASTQFNWSTRQCLAFAERAEGLGADAVKAQIDWRLRPAEDLVAGRYLALAAGSPIPLLAYALGQGTFGASPAISGPSLALFRRLVEMAGVVGMKNDAGDFYEQTAYLAEVRRSGRRFEVITGGSMESFLHGHRFGQRAYAVALAMLAPERVQAFDASLSAGRDGEAGAVVRDLEQPVGAAFAGVGHWAALHEALHLQGWFPSSRVRFPLRTLDPDEAHAVRRTMEAHGLL